MNFFDVMRFERGMRIYNHDTVLNLSDLIRKKIELFAAIGRKKNISIEAGEITDNLLILTDAFAIERVVNNLLENAIKYTNPGGTVSTELGLDNTMAELKIRDTGIGIALNQIPRIFMPYYQLSRKKENTQGIGMGLAIVSRIVKELNGKGNKQDLQCVLCEKRQTGSGKAQ